MRVGDKRLTKEEIELMRQLYRHGISLSAIGRKFNRDHTTVLYWIKKFGDKRPPLITRGKEAKLLTKKLLKKPEAKEKLKKIKEHQDKFCIRCGKEKKDSRWKKTRYCSLKCWVQRYTNPKITGNA